MTTDAQGPNEIPYPERLAETVHQTALDLRRRRMDQSLPHIQDFRLKTGPIGFINLLHRKDPEALKAYLEDYGAILKEYHQRESGSMTRIEVILSLLDGFYRTRGWHWKLYVPALVYEGSRDYHLYHKGLKDPCKPTFDTWVGEAALLIVELAMVPANVLPETPSDLAVALCEGRDLNRGRSAGAYLPRPSPCALHGPYGNASILINHLHRSSTQTLGTLAHELIHATKPEGPSHGPEFRKRAYALGLFGISRNPARAGFDARGKFPEWAFKALERLGSMPENPNPFPKRRGLASGIRLNSCLHALHLPARRP